MKAIAQMIPLMVVGFLTVTLSLFMYMIFVANFFEIHLSVQSNEVGRHALIMQNALMASPQLAYVDDYQLHKGVFDADKLETNLDSAIEELSYANSVSFIRIRDLETGKLYANAARVRDTSDTTAEARASFECLVERSVDFAEDAASLRIMHLFDIFNSHSFDSCVKSEVSERGFHRGVDLGVTIRVVDPATGDVEYHPAIMSISLYEL